MREIRQGYFAVAVNSERGYTESSPIRLALFETKYSHHFTITIDKGVLQQQREPPNIAPLYHSALLFNKRA